MDKDTILRGVEKYAIQGEGDESDLVYIDDLEHILNSLVDDKPDRHRQIPSWHDTGWVHPYCDCSFCTKARIQIAKRKWKKYRREKEKAHRQHFRSSLPSEDGHIFPNFPDWLDKEE